VKIGVIAKRAEIARKRAALRCELARRRLEIDHAYRKELEPFRE